MNVANIKPLDIANASGISSSIFFSGCTLKCSGCFNTEAQDFNYGKLYTKDVEDEFLRYLRHPQVKNANILGGEVFQQDLKTVLNLVKRIKEEVKKPIWVWSGYLYENLLKDKAKLEILKYIDILVDGQFVEELKDLNLKYRGSSNQRVIDVQESLNQGKTIFSKNKQIN